jgi:ABC-type glycerol-3-phosphate transport system substrate-binding protein
MPTQIVAPTPESAGEILVWLDWEPEEVDTLLEIIQSFQVVYPTVQISINYYPEDELLVAFEEASLDGTPPTILFGPSLWGPRLFEGELILDPISMVSAELERRIHPTAWSQVMYESNVVGLPLEFMGTILYRNRLLTDEAPRTVDSWIEAGIGQRGEEGIEVLLDLGFDFSAPQVSVCGGSFLGPEGEVTLEMPEGTCWLELLVELRAIGPAVMNSEDDLQRFSAGGSAWLVEETSSIGEFTDALGVTNVKVDPWPLYESVDRPLQSLVWTENVYLSSGISAKDLEITWAFVEYLYSAESQATLSDFQGAAHIPVDMTVELIDSNMIEMASMLRAGVPMLLLRDPEVYIETIEDAVDDVVFQGVEPAVAAQILIEQLQQIPAAIDG